MFEAVLGYVGWYVILALIILLPLLLFVGYLSYFERKIVGYMQGRYGPNRLGWFGILQPIADLLKLLAKEIIHPSQANLYLFLIAPLLSLMPAMLAWAVIPFDDNLVFADINAGLLFLFAMSSLGIYGILIAGWATNSKYAMLGALRAVAQTISYEISMGLALVGVLMCAGSMNLQTIVNQQAGSILNWYIWPLLPLFVVFWLSGVAETNRAPFDIAEGESEIVAGFHVEYSGTAFALFFIAEYMNMTVISLLTALFFLGGWLSPFAGIPWLATLFDFVPGIVWLLIKTCLFLFVYMWLRATLPRYRYDQLMYLGWKVLIPLTIVWIIIVAIMIKLEVPPWF